MHLAAKKIVDGNCSSLRPLAEKRRKRPTMIPLGGVVATLCRSRIAQRLPIPPVISS